MPKAFSGFGIGLRPPHYSDVLAQHDRIDFVEVISENFMIVGGRPLWVLDQVRERLPVALHGVSMSIGAVDGVNRDYLARLKRLVDRVDPLFVSDHLCWTGIGGTTTHDLLPLPLTAEALDVVCRNVDIAQDVLQREILLENPSAYIQFDEDEFAEAEFLAEVCRRSSCSLLLDVNNIFVSTKNLATDASAALSKIPKERVKQIHIAGHSQGTSKLIDTHDAPVCDDVWSLYREALNLFGEVPSMIERDDKIPAFSVLMEEVEDARRIAQEEWKRPTA